MVKEGLALIKITKSPYRLLSSSIEYICLALIKITKSPYHRVVEEIYSIGLALIKITKSPYLSQLVL